MRIAGCIRLWVWSPGMFLRWGWPGLLTETSRGTGLGDELSRVLSAWRRLWDLAGEHSPTAGISAERPLAIDVDATLVNVHSEKEGAAPTFEKGFGYHPLTAWFDHGPGQGAGECAAIMLRPGNAGSNTAADHVEIIRWALDQAGLGPRSGRAVIAHHARRTVLRYKAGHPWISLLLDGLRHLQALPAP